jgi:hypothetical protein
MRSPHTIEIPFVFHNIAIAGPLISKMPEAFALAEKVSASWVAFARTGDPNTAGAPRWPAYSAGSRDTMLFQQHFARGAGSGPRTAAGNGAGAKAFLTGRSVFAPSIQCSSSDPGFALMFPPRRANVHMMFATDIAQYRMLQSWL